MLKVLVANNAGFCFGVRRAIEAAEKHAADGNCYMLGSLIHNQSVVDKLKASGLKQVESVDDLPALLQGETGKVIIRSHGADERTYAEIKNKGYGIVDATCPFVVKIHEIVEAHYEAGYHIVIIGGAAHPEVIATSGWCENTATVIDEDSDLSPLLRYDKLCFVCQTTFDAKKFKEISKKIHEIRAKTVEIFDTICYTTYERQEEAVRLAESSDAVLVVGDKSSSNTNKLFDICAAVNRNTHFIGSVGELENIKFPRSGVVGIVAGASTPTESIMEVKTYMGQDFGEAKNQEFIEAINNETTVSIREGKAVTGTVIVADAEGIHVNIGGKIDGFIDKSEASEDEYKPEDYPAGAEITAIVMKKRDDATGCRSDPQRRNVRDRRQKGYKGRSYRLARYLSRICARIANPS